MAKNIELSSPCISDSEARCHCGQLMAILKKEGVELKCKRCKRLILIPFTSFTTDDDSNLSFQHGYENRMSGILTSNQQ